MSAMDAPRMLRRLGVAAAAGAVIAPLVGPVAGPAAAIDYATTGKHFAYQRYHWGPVAWEYTFERRPFPRAAWTRGGVGAMGEHFGMITLDSSSTAGATATLTKHPEAYGRWEVRLRSKRFPHQTGGDYAVETELVPASDPNGHCGGQTIDFGSYVSGSSATSFALHALPSYVYSATRKKPHRDDYWHTYAVEVTRTHVSWFLDGRVQVTERAPSALSGVPYELRLALVPRGSGPMKKTRLMVDTVRYFSLKHGRQGVTRTAPTAGTETYC